MAFESCVVHTLEVASCVAWWSGVKRSMCRPLSMENMTRQQYSHQLSVMVQDNFHGIQDLYERMPFFVRMNLYDFINRTSWSGLHRMCQQNAPTAQNEAHDAMALLDELMRHFIQQENDLHADSECPISEKSTIMTFARRHINAHFGKDPTSLVAEMSNILAREKELVQLFSSNEQVQSPSMVNHATSERRLNYQRQLKEMNKDMEALNELMQKFVGDGSGGQSPLGGALSETIGQISASDLQELGKVPFEHFTQLPQTEGAISNEVQEKLSSIMDNLKSMMDDLEQGVKDWKLSEALASVKTGPKVDLHDLKEDFSQFTSVLCPLSKMVLVDQNLALLFQCFSSDEVPMGPLAIIYKEVQEILKRFFKCNMVVSIQPKEMVSIEKASPKVPAAKKKESHYKSKKRQGLNTTIILMGARQFSDLSLRATRIELVADKDLAEELTSGTACQTSQCGKVDGVHQDFSNNGQDYIIRWADVEIREFSRLDTNAVYRQFFRFRYTVDIEVNGMEMSLKTMSLPFTFNTGSNQQLEHLGSRMWYCSNVAMYDGSFQCPDQLPVDTVLDMLDRRLQCATPRARGLDQKDKDFLDSRLVKKDGNVSIQVFIKEKMPDTNGEEDQPPFNTWFHGVVNSFMSILPGPWQDRVIYGFCKPSYAYELLMESKVPAGTVLFRPSMWRVENPSSLDATTALIMETKQSYPSAPEKFHVQSVPIYMSLFKTYGFHKGVCNIKKDGQRLAKFLYGANGSDRKLIDCLMQYGGGDTKPYICEKYKLILRKTETLTVESFDPEDEPVSPPSGTPVKKHRKRRPDTRSASQGADTTDGLEFTGDSAVIKSEMSSPPAQQHMMQQAQAQEFHKLGSVSVDFSNISNKDFVKASPGGSSGFGSAMSSPGAQISQSPHQDAFILATDSRSSGFESTMIPTLDVATAMASQQYNGDPSHQNAATTCAPPEHIQIQWFEGSANNVATSEQFQAPSASTFPPGSSCAQDFERSTFFAGPPTAEAQQTSEVPLVQQGNIPYVLMEAEEQTPRGSRTKKSSAQRVSNGRAMSSTAMIDLQPVQVVQTVAYTDPQLQNPSLGGMELQDQFIPTSQSGEIPLQLQDIYMLTNSAEQWLPDGQHQPVEVQIQNQQAILGQLLNSNGRMTSPEDAGRNSVGLFSGTSISQG